ncbi:hypothetical protein CSKR_105847, partial [Clonorchis sinensis]
DNLAEIVSYFSQYSSKPSKVTEWLSFVEELISPMKAFTLSRVRSKASKLIQLLSNEEGSSDDHLAEYRRKWKIFLQEEYPKFSKWEDAPMDARFICESYNHVEPPSLQLPPLPGNDRQLCDAYDRFVLVHGELPDEEYPYDASDGWEKLYRSKYPAGNEDYENLARITYACNRLRGQSEPSSVPPDFASWTIFVQENYPELGGWKDTPLDVQYVCESHIRKRGSPERWPPFPEKGKELCEVYDSYVERYGNISTVEDDIFKSDGWWKTLQENYPMYRGNHLFEEGGFTAWICRDEKLQGNEIIGELCTDFEEYFSGRKQLTTTETSTAVPETEATESSDNNKTMLLRICVDYYDYFGDGGLTTFETPTLVTEVTTPQMGQTIPAFAVALCGWNNRGAGRISRLTVETTYRLFPRDMDSWGFGLPLAICGH